MDKKLNPGSKEAIEKGCGCPRLDNHHGQGSGFIAENGDPLFWYSEDCPIHGHLVPKSKDEEIKNE